MALCAISEWILHAWTGSKYASGYQEAFTVPLLVGLFVGVCNDMHARPSDHPVLYIPTTFILDYGPNLDGWFQKVSFQPATMACSRCTLVLCPLWTCWDSFICCISSSSIKIECPTTLQFHVIVILRGEGEGRKREGVYVMMMCACWSLTASQPVKKLYSPSCCLMHTCCVWLNGNKQRNKGCCLDLFMCVRGNRDTPSYRLFSWDCFAILNLEVWWIRHITDKCVMCERRKCDIQNIDWGRGEDDTDKKKIKREK